jgi:hypothetical protein
MRGRATLAALSTILLTPVLGAQRGGMAGGHASFTGHGGGFAAHGPMIAGHTGVGFNRGGFISGAPRGVPFGGVGFTRPLGFDNRFFHNRFRHHSFFLGSYPWWYYGYWGYPWYGGYYSYPWYYGSNWYGDEGYRQEQSEIQRERDEIGRERAEIDQLEDEVGRLRQERQPPPTKPEAKSDIHSLTVLVFRDKHTQEVQNYALIGQTLWILNEEKATKIPLADVDVPATVKANDERGVDFRVPR